MKIVSLLKNLTALFFCATLIALAVLFVHHREHTLSAGWKYAAPSREALFYTPLADGGVRCSLCPNECMIAPGQCGACKARQNIQGKLHSMVYGLIATAHVDPIEKKPLFHVLPASKAFSIASTGCNMRCLFCQNWEISQSFPGDVESRPATPEQVVEQALQSGSRSIAFTYNEPIINYEFVLDVAKLAKGRNFKTVMISNGYIREEPLRELLKYIDAYKVDLKAFDQRFYSKFTGGRLEPVLRSLKVIKESGVWLEIVVLLVPGQNDDPESIRAMARWIKENLGDQVPLHFSRFHPQYKLQNLPPTPPESILRAREIARDEGLKYVYTGNIANPEGETTYCPRSGEKAIVRQGYFVTANHLVNGACPDGETIPGIWE